MTIVVVITAITGASESDGLSVGVPGVLSAL